MSDYHLAQLNIARMLAPLNSPKLADFVANLDRINSLAEESPGFVWRLVVDHDDPSAHQAFGWDVLVNMSVWEGIEPLHAFVYRTAHVEIMSRRKEWFAQMAEAFAVLWWVPAGHQPTLAEAKERLERLRQHGPTPDAFTFKEPFDAPGAPRAPLDDACPAGS